MRLLVRCGVSLAAAFVIAIFAYAAGEAPQSNSWIAVGELNVARANAASVLLDDGRVLVTGGRTADGSLRSTELFTPAAGFNAAGEMLSERSGHAAVKLDDGRVLVTGGVAADGMAVNSAEIYDPSTNDWHAVPASMSEARAGHTATLLGDGRVLIAGGDVAGVPSSTFEVYDPNLDEFRVAGVLSAPRMQHAAAHLADGRVLIAGGTDGNVPLASADVLDADAGWVGQATMVEARTGLTATTLLDGKVLVTGGANAIGELTSAEVFDPATGSFTPTDNALTAARRNHLAFLLPHNNQVLIVGGLAGGNAVATAEYFTPWDGANGTFCAAPVCASGYAGPAAPATTRAWATASALSFPASATNRSGPGDGLFLLAGGSGQRSAELLGFATVKTDKDDYAPGTTVTITGSGWQPYESVALVLVEQPLLDTHPLLDVTADGNGNIVSTEFKPDIHDLNIRFMLTAYGTASQAQTTFTDALNLQIVGKDNAQHKSVGSEEDLGSIAQGTTLSLTCPRGTGLTVRGTGSGSTTWSLGYAGPGADNSTLSPLTILSPSSASSESDVCVAMTINTDTLIAGTTFHGSLRVEGSGANSSDYFFRFAVSAGAATTTTNAADATATYGDSSVGLSATVTSSSTVNTGTVTFTVKNGGTTIGASTTSGTVSGGNATVSYNLPAGTDAGSYSIEAVYNAGAGFSGSSDATPGTLTVNPKGVTVSISGGPFTYDGSSHATAVTTTPSAVSHTVNYSRVSPVYNSATPPTDAGTYTVTVTITNSDYTLSGSGTGSITISPAPITATAGSGTSTYDGATKSPSACVVSGTYTGTLACTNNPASVGPEAGMTTISPAVSGPAQSNFEITLTNGSYEIKKAPVTATAGSGAGFYNGSTQSPSACVVSGVYTGDLACANNPASVGPEAGTTTISPAVSGPAQSNFEITLANGSYEIKKAPVTATAGSGAGFYNGSTQSPSACVVSGTYTGVLACTNNPASVGPEAGTTTIAPIVSGPGLTNFAVTTVNGSFQIKKALVTATAGSGTGTYNGSTQSPSACVVSGVYTGDLACANNPDAVGPGVGTTAISALVSGTGQANFEITLANGSYEIKKALVTATAGSGSGFYNGSTQSPSACVVSGVYTGDLACANNPDAVGPGVGTTAISAVVSGTGQANFEITLANGSYEIKKALVTATAGSGSGFYNGSTQSPSACVVSGTFTGDLACTNDPASVGPGVGTTTIGPVVSGPAQSNFEITLTNGSYEIKKAPVTATAGSGSGFYHGATQSPSACVVSGTFTGDLACTNNPASVGPGVGTSTIVPVVNGTAQSNFEITLTNGSYEIKKAPVMATAGSGSGFYNGSTQSPSACVVSGTFTGDLACTNDPASVGPGVGTSTIVPVVNGPAQNNFEITLTNGFYEIKKAPVTATAGGGSGFYHGATQSPSACVVTGAYTGDLACTNNPASVGPGVGTTTISPLVSGTGLTNFAVTTVNGSFEIKKAATTTTVSSANAIFDGGQHGGTAVVVGPNLNLPLTVTYKGIGGTVYSPSTTAPTNPGTYSATASYDENANYLGSTDTKTFTIGYGVCSAGYGPGAVIMQPINSDGTSVYSRKGGSTIPVKFTVCDAAGMPVSNAIAVFAGGTAGPLTMLSAVRGTIDVITEPGISEIPDVAFRWAGDKWIFNMATSNLTAGMTYTFRINLAAGSIQFRVGVK